MNPGSNAGGAEPQGGRVVLLGPGGCGKSLRLREEFLARVTGSGPNLDCLLLVPTASYRDHTRNLLLRESALRGLSGDSVCTFKDLLRRLGSARETAEISAARRELMVARLLRELALPAFERVAAFPGFRAALAEAADEARAAGLTPEQLQTALAGSASGQQRAFLTFFRSYDGALTEAGADERVSLQAVLEALRRHALPLKLLLVDGFTDFTYEQRAVLQELAAGTPSVRVALTLTADGEARELFYQAERSRAWLRGLGFSEEWLAGNHRARAAVLKTLEHELRGERLSGIAEDRDDGLVLIEAADRRDEVELIAREVLRLVRSGRCRYRDIGIILRQEGQYLGPVRGVFRRLGIPLRAFVRGSLAASVAGRHFRLCLDLFLPGSRPESLIAWLKSPYCISRSRTNVERFEYAAIERLADAREGRWSKCLPRDVRLPVLERIRTLDEQLVAARSVAGLCAWAGEAWQQLTDLGNLRPAESQEDVLDLRQDAAACRRVPALLKEIAEAAAAEGLREASFEQFHSLLVRLMAAETLPFRDRRQDAVNVMNAFEARQWELKAVFIPGLVEQEFPAAGREALFLRNDHRERVAAGGIAWLPTTADQARDERLLFYVAATRAGDLLYLTRPRTDSEGKELLRSFFLRDLSRLLRSPACRVLRRRRAEVVCPPELAANRADLLAVAHAELATRAPNIHSEAQQGARAIYERLREGGETGRALRQAAARASRLTHPAALARLRETAVHFTVSALEDFAECHFKCFAKHLLRLKQQAEPDQLDALREGSIAHATIEKWVRGGASRPILEVLGECFAKGTEGIPPGHEAVKARAQLELYLERFEKAERARGAVYLTEVRADCTELRFGGGQRWAGGEVFPPLRVELGAYPAEQTGAAEELGWRAAISAAPSRLAGMPAGVEQQPGTAASTAPAVVEIEGRLDRVETAVREGARMGIVVDFKYSQDGFSDEVWEQIEQGRSLQLPAYLLALKEVFGIVPAGAELYALKAPESARSGLYDQRYLSAVVRDGVAPEGGRELAGAEFEQLMEQTRAWIRRYAEAIRAGMIRVSQTDAGGCDRCDYNDVCRVMKWQIQQIQEQQTEQNR